MYLPIYLSKTRVPSYTRYETPVYKYLSLKGLCLRSLLFATQKVAYVDIPASREPALMSLPIGSLNNDILRCSQDKSACSLDFDQL